MLERVWKIGNPLTLLMGMRMDTTTMEKSMDVPLKLGIKLPYDPAIPLLGIYPEETGIEKDRCTPMLIAAIFTIARTQKQPRCPSAHEWVTNDFIFYFFKEKNFGSSSVFPADSSTCWSPDSTA